ncbi:MAG: hypothetical protein VB135_04705, partial [Burkholderia sp.]
WASCHPMKPVRQPPSKRPPELQNRVKTIRAGTDIDTPASNEPRSMQRVRDLAMRGVELGELIADRRAIDAAREAFWKRWNSGAPTDHAAIAMAKRAA